MCWLMGLGMMGVRLIWRSACSMWIAGLVIITGFTLVGVRIVCIIATRLLA